MDQALYIGLMSGTSMDGVDAVLVEFPQNNTHSQQAKPQPKLIDSLCFDMPADLKQQLLQLISPDWQGSLYEIGIIDQKLGKLFAAAVQALLKQSHTKAESVLAVGSHGQTVWHQPQGKHPFTLQLGDPTHIAEQCNITTVADFRRMDMAASGQGAPLVPAFHQQILTHPHKNRLIVNIGGISNITVLPALENEQDEIIGFDTGTGNGLMDAWIQQCHSVPYDKNGTWAKSGCCNAKLLAACLEDPYFYLPYPKSTGKEYFNLDWLNRCYPNLDQLYPVDVQATLTELTAQSIIFAMQSLEISIDEVLLCGGGHYNQFLVSRLQTHLDSIPLHSTEASGIHPDWVEAIAFAWLAQQTMQGKSGNLAEATGAKGGRVLGAIHQADKT